MTETWRKRMTPLPWFVAGAVALFAGFTWAFVAWHNLADERDHDRAVDTYQQCMQNADRGEVNHETQVSQLQVIDAYDKVLHLAVQLNSDNTDPTAASDANLRQIAVALEQASAAKSELQAKVDAYTVRDCSSIKPGSN